jgi:hypothetical protein
VKNQPTTKTKKRILKKRSKKKVAIRSDQWEITNQPWEEDLAKSGYT